MAMTLHRRSSKTILFLSINAYFEIKKNETSNCYRRSVL